MTIHVSNIVNILEHNFSNIGYVEAYVFGSASLFKTAPNDIDILIIYETINQAKKIRQILSDVNNIPIHLLFLTREEETETNFIFTQKCIQIF